uniref:Uncharacterized protein n=1 Tax=Octopus bimaculoides TaxID=37653 RepID=A0A0L8ICY5_OCTBM
MYIRGRLYPVLYYVNISWRMAPDNDWRSKRSRNSNHTNIEDFFHQSVTF